LHFAKDGMKIDLGGIAKGYAIDAVIQLWTQQAIKHGIISVGGDTRVMGENNGRPWVLGIRNPRGDGSVIKLPIIDASVSTSGDYERFFIEEGRRYHHILKPSTGISVRSVLSATVIADTTVDSDALSTTVFVLGAEAGLALIESLANTSCIIIDNKGKVHYSSDLSPHR